MEKKTNDDKTVAILKALVEVIDQCFNDDEEEVPMNMPQSILHVHTAIYRLAETISDFTGVWAKANNVDFKPRRWVIPDEDDPICTHKGR